TFKPIIAMNKNNFSMVAALWLMGISVVQSQNFSEWFRQSKTQRYYLKQQIKALKFYNYQSQRGYDHIQKSIMIFGCIIGRIQQKMLEVDIQQIETYQDTFFSDTDAAYLIFLTIGINGYFTVPSVANSIVQASTRNTLTYKLNSLAHHTTQQLYTSAIALSALWGSHSSSNSEGSSYGHTVKESYQDSYLNDKIQNPN